MNLESGNSSKREQSRVAGPPPDLFQVRPRRTVSDWNHVFKETVTLDKALAFESDTILSRKHRDRLCVLNRKRFPIARKSRSRTIPSRFSVLSARVLSGNQAFRTVDPLMEYPGNEPRSESVQTGRHRNSFIGFTSSI